MNQFPPGARFYDWNTLPMATVSGPKGRTCLNYAVDPPTEIESMDGLHTAREVEREVFEELRAAQRKIFPLLGFLTRAAVAVVLVDSLLAA